MIMRLMSLKWIVMLLVVAISSDALAQRYKAKSGNVSFLSEEVFENIEAKSKKLIGAMDSTSQKVAFVVRIKSFDFKLDKMKEHFNEDYMESSKYPKASFKGKINEKINFSVDSVYNVTVTGTLSVHGVDTVRTIKGTLQVLGGKVIIKSEFPLNVKDHNIKIPKIMFQKIAETVKVKVYMSMLKATLPKKK